MARPTKFTLSTQTRIIEAIAGGNYYEAACASAGVDYATFRRWMQRGQKAKDGPYREFCDAILKAEAEAEVRIVAQWQQQIPENWPAARDFLARRFPDRWGPKERHIVEGDAERPLTIRTLTVEVPLLTNNDEILLLTEGEQHD